MFNQPIELKWKTDAAEHGGNFIGISKLPLGGFNCIIDAPSLRVLCGMLADMLGDDVEKLGAITEVITHELNFD